MRCRFLALCLCTAFGIPALSSGAQAPTKAFPPATDLPAACLAAKASFKPITDEDVRWAKAQLIGAIERLDRRLKADGPNGEQWRKYLQWDKLQAELKQSQPNFDALMEIYKRYSADEEGLGMVWFLDVRDAIWRYRFYVGMKGAPAFEKGFASILDGLAANLQDYVAEPTSQKALAIGQALGQLEDARQVPELVEAVRHHVARPNLFLHASSKVTSTALDENVDEDTPVRDVILGATIRGTGHTVGETRSHLRPDDRFGLLDIIFLGIAKTRNVASKGPARVHSAGTTRIGACKRLWIDETGLHGLPAVSNAITSTRFTCIQTVRGGRIIERIVQKKAYQQKGMGERTASHHAEQRINRRVDERAAKMLAEANDSFTRKFRRPLIEHRLFPQTLDFTSTDSALRVVSLEADALQLAAPSEPPELAGDADLGLRIHESMLNNLAASALAGRTLRSETLESSLIDLFGKLPDRLKQDEDRAPWAIRFDQDRPIWIAFSDNGLTVTIRGKRYYKAGEPHPAMNVTASYKFVKTDTGFKAVRQGDVEILPPGFKRESGERLSNEELVILPILERRFGKIFEPELILDGFTPEKRLAPLGKVKPIQMTGEKGWLVAAWKAPEK